MKTKFISLLVLLSLSLSSYSQMQWKATYQYKRILSEEAKAKNDSLIKSQPEMANIIKRINKRFNNRTYILEFTKNESIFKEEKQLAKPGKNSFRTMGRNDRILYKNISKKIRLEKLSFFSDTYLINDTLPDYKWKVTGENKQIGKYLVIKAEGIATILKREWRKEDKKSTKKVIAWFTPEIPISNGPKNFYGLPGLIMEINIDDEIYLCKEVIVNPKNKSEIKKPKEGKKITQSKFNQIRKEQIEKMNKIYKSRRNGNGRKGDVIRLRIN